MVVKVDIAGPGFINLTLRADVWGEELRSVIAAGTEYGRSTFGAGEKVNVEYVSANPTGPMHVGHGRGAVFGDALANLLAFAGDDTSGYDDAGVAVAPRLSGLRAPRLATQSKGTRIIRIIRMLRICPSRDRCSAHRGSPLHPQSSCIDWNGLGTIQCARSPLGRGANPCNP